MESIPVAKIARQEALQQWLIKETQEDHLKVIGMPGDASFRRYFRIEWQGQTFVVMDAPPPENCASFVMIAKLLRQAGLHTPDVLAMDLNRGFLLLSDFGDDTYLRILIASNADSLYTRACDALAQLQQCRSDAIPLFSSALMWQEWELHHTWFIQKWLQLDSTPYDTKLNDVYAHLVSVATQQPQVFMHRDYHSGNLMKLANHEVGILDFQDAFIGPITYDLVSLLRDCYIDWPQEKINHWVHHYYLQLTRNHNLNVDLETFHYWFDLMGVQRHLKALMTFSRKALRDHQPAYLSFVPRTLNYIITVSGLYPILSDLNEFMVNEVAPNVTRKCQ